jgi:DNA-binding response OmpR family regulator
MNASKRDLIRRTLRNLAESHAATIELMEQALVLLSEELAIDAVSFWKSRKSAVSTSRSSKHLFIDHDRLQVAFHGRRCILGNTLSFRFLERLARRPNTYVTHDELLVDVWQGVRSESAIRSVVKRLRQTLRQQGLSELAAAIDGKSAGRYCLRLEN